MDNDPVVLSHARALLADDVTTIVVAGDLREPKALLDNPEVRAHLDFSQPIGLLLCGILHHILDSENPRGLTEALVASLPSGSYVFIHHLLDSGDPAAAELPAIMQAGMARGQFRTREHILAMFGELELVPPGLVIVPERTGRVEIPPPAGRTADLADHAAADANVALRQAPGGHHGAATNHKVAVGPGISAAHLRHHSGAAIRRRQGSADGRHPG